MHGARFYGFGTLWMREQRRGDFAEDIRAIRSRHGYLSEIKWKKVSPRYLDCFLDLVRYFFATDWLSFHCKVIRKELVRLELHANDPDLARRKHFTQLLTIKMNDLRKAHPNREQSFRVWVDPIASRYKKADEVVGIIARRVLARAGANEQIVRGVHEKDSKDVDQIQLCDLLLGAVMSQWQQETTASHKVAVRSEIAKHLGWSDLAADTWRTERKFNIWYFHDPTLGPREAKTREVALLHPLPARPIRPTRRGPPT